MTSWAQASLLCESGVSPGQGKLGTHRNKIGASEVPNDSCGCADAHMANDGEKPPAEHSSKRTRLSSVIQLGDATEMHVNQRSMVSHSREVPGLPLKGHKHHLQHRVQSSRVSGKIRQLSHRKLSGVFCKLCLSSSILRMYKTYIVPSVTA